MKLLLKAILSLVIIFIIIGAGGFIYLTRGLNTVGKEEIKAVNLAVIEDGIYTGAYDGGRWSNELKVTVTNHRITKIDIVKDVTISIPEVTKVLFNRVIAEQNTTVDAVSEATVTSKAYLKAIEDALNK